MSFEEYIQNPKEKFVVLRHDVDKLPANSLKTAKIEHGLGIKGSYYFRIVPENYNEYIIRQIADLGHEIGYHYEDLTLASHKFNVQSSKLKMKRKFLKQRLRIFD